jgi:hypothetical protein
MPKKKQIKKKAGKKRPLAGGKKKAAPKKRPSAGGKKEEKLPKPVGRVTHFYTSIRVMIAKFLKPIRVGTLIRIKGATTDFVQKIDSMQFDHKPVKVAQKNKQIGIKVKKRVRQGDKIYPSK